MDEQGRPSVVVGVDGSGAALNAVRWATAEAHRRRAPLQILHAAPDALGDPTGKRRAAAVLAVAAAVAGDARPGVPTHTECVFDDPSRALAAAAEPALLLVVGMQGGNPLDDAFLPSVALDACAASCPVVVVRGNPAPADGPVVLGLEDIGRDAAAVTAAFADADRTETRLVVVHALRGPDAVLDAVAGHPASARVVAEKEVTAVLAPWRSRYPDVPVEVRVVPGAPVRRLLEAAVPARLLVVGAHARSAGARFLLGSTSRAVVRHSPCPVMVVRRDAHVLDPTTQDATGSAAVAAPRSWALRPHDRSELW